VLAALFLDEPGRFIGHDRLGAMAARGARKVVCGRGGLASATGPVAINEDRMVYGVALGNVAGAAALRGDLIEAGHRLDDESLGTLVVHGYEHWGATGLAARLRGAFCFAIWDARRQVAILGVDQFAQWPLYYSSRRPGMAASTDLAAVLRSGLCLPTLDQEAAWGFLVRGHVAGPRTLVAGVHQVAAGSTVEWTPGEWNTTVRAYWRPRPSTSVPDIEALHGLLRTAVEEAQPRVCFVDSPLAAAALSVPGARSVSFNLTEVEPAGLASVRQITDDEILTALRPTESTDPNAHAGAVVAAVAGKACASVTAHGLVELLGLAPWYRRVDERPDHRQRLRDAAAAIHHLESLMGHPFPPVDGTAAEPISRAPLAASPALLWCVLHPDTRPPIELLRLSLGNASEAVGASEDLTSLQRAIVVDLSLRVGPMARAWRSRTSAWSPFLVRQVVEDLLALPDEVRLGKPPLATRLCGVGAVTHDNLIQDRWLAGPLATAVRTVLRDATLVESGFLSRSGLSRLLELRHAVPLGKLLINLLVLELWWRQAAAATADCPAKPAVVNTAPTVDILIPIHEGLHYVRDCLRTLFAHTTGEFRVLLIDDASCQETHRRLAELAATDGRIELLRNERNLGFLRTCERGFAWSTAEYVVILNSDTLVTPGWLERMLACAQSNPAIAFVNPLSNESGNTSVPMAPGLNYRTMASRVAEVSRRTYPSLTTGVGMCALLRRSALEWLGTFDLAFQNAYGEESDLCMRLTEAGLRVVAADDAFVYHKGRGSYADGLREELLKRNLALFDQRWRVPYGRDWAAYERRNPLQYIRDALHRDTVEAAAAHPVLRAVIDHRAHRLETREVLAATDSGRRVGAAIALLGDRAEVPGRYRALDWRVSRQSEPPIGAGRRVAMLPLRHYTRALAKPAPGKLRITFLSALLRLAGGVIQFTQLARELLLAGHDVQVVTEAPDCYPEELNLPVQPLVFDDTAHMVEAFPESDVVVATFWVTARNWMRPLRQRHRFVSVSYLQDYEVWFCPEHAYALRQEVLRSYKATDRHIATSHWLASKLAAHGYAPEVVPIGIDLDVYYPRKPKSDRFRVVSVAAPKPEDFRRGFGHTVETLRLLHESVPECEIVLFGAGDSDLPQLPFPYTNAGRITDPQRVADLISSAHVLLDASLWQAFGRPGLEAMACGTAAVLTDEGGVHEYAKHDVNCLLVRPGVPEQAARAIARLAADQKLRDRLVEQGFATATRFGHRVEAERHLELYISWVEQARRQ
jgi:GT2 family glycosyltransferase/glycosyltransferase involved in cell wall biosynthesis